MGREFVLPSVGGSWGGNLGVSCPLLSPSSIQLGGSPSSCLHGGEHKVKAAALKALLSQLQTGSLYPAVQQPSASTRQDSCSRDDKYVAVQDML